MRKRMKKFSKACLCAVMLLILVTTSFSALAADAFTQGETMKVYFDNSVTNWNKVMVYVGDKGEGWPGTAMSAVEGRDNVWEAEVPADIDLLIFNNNQEEPKQQSQDIKGQYIVADGEYVGTTQSGKIWTVLRKAEDGSLVEETVPTQTIYYDNSKTKWDNIYLHYWGNGETTWPGKLMEATDDENIFKLEIPQGVSGMVINSTVNGVEEKSFDINDIVDGATYVAVDFDASGKWAVCRNDNIPAPPENPTDEQKTPAQVNTHVGEDYSTVYLSFTTVGEIDSKVTVKDENGVETVYNGEHSYSYVSENFKHKIVLTDLKPSMKYTYTIGENGYSFSGSFTTIPNKGSSDSVKFAYITDPQIGDDVNAKAAGATFAQLNKYDDLGFVYIGGDITDNADNKNQWEDLFVNSGAYPTAGLDCLSNNLLAVTMGNHDKDYNNSSLSGYINAPAEAGDLVYSVDYGVLKFVVLNLEFAGADEAVREQQREYLEAEVADAKNNGQWVIVGFHKSIYSGASHIVDSDVIEARKYWSPILSALDVDVVLQAHDHVYARGFVKGDGSRGEVEQDETGAYISKDNAPLYMVGGHAGGLKWYSKKDYTVSEGDPLLPNYEFLDVNSADGDNGSDKTQQQVYTIFEVNDSEITSTTYMFKYDTDTDTITTQPYVYDTVTIKRDVTDVPEQPTEPTEATEPTEGTEPTQGTEPTEGTEPTQGTEPTEGTEPTQGTEPTEGTESTQGTEPTEGTAPTEVTEPTQGTEPTEDTTSAETTVVTNVNDSTQGTNSTDTTNAVTGNANISDNNSNGNGKTAAAGTVATGNSNNSLVLLLVLLAATTVAGFAYRKLNK